MRNFELPGRSPVFATNGMAATSHSLATQTAVEILQSGGNAMDAAIAACAVQCVVEPGSTAIGGDNFCLYSPGGGDNIIGYNGSGRAPAAVTPEKLAELGVLQLERTSPHSVIIPGAVDAWCQLNADHGTMELAELLRPAIDLARKGYAVSPRVHFDWTANKDHLQSNENLARIFLPDGEVPSVGSLHFQPGLADALEMIGREGRDAFYRGELATEIVETLQAKGGLHTLDDFANAKGEYVTPISSQFRDHTIHQCPPNGQGVIALLLLNLFEGAPKTDLLSAERIHFELEACARAYGIRDHVLADPAQSSVPVDELLSKAYADKLRDTIDPMRKSSSGDSLPMPRHKDTVYITVVDKDRNACSFINTLFWGWGSGITTPKHGIVLTNRGEGFVLDPEHPNCIAPNKRPLHTIIPGMITKDGKTVMSYGVMGGEYQAMGHAQFLSRYFDYGLDIQEAQDAPRFMVDPFDGSVEMEGAVPEAIVAELKTMGHEIQPDSKPVGGSQAIAINWENGILTGGSDPRKDGCAIGY